MISHIIMKSLQTSLNSSINNNLHLSAFSHQGKKEEDGEREYSSVHTCVRMISSSSKMVVSVVRTLHFRKTKLWLSPARFNTLFNCEQTFSTLEWINSKHTRAGKPIQTTTLKKRHTWWVEEWRKEGFWRGGGCAFGNRLQGNREHFLAEKWAGWSWALPLGFLPWPLFWAPAAAGPTTGLLDTLSALFLVLQTSFWKQKRSCTIRRHR